MIFGDEPRFSKKLVAHPVDGSICGVSKSSTEDHVGPGSYLAQQFEERRSGWQRHSFSNRQPMQEPKNAAISRSDYYTGGVLSPNGTMAMPASPARSRSPGPGYYEGPPSIFSFPTDAHRKQDLNLTSMSGASVQNISTRPTTMSSTPRFAFANSACLNKGVLFQSAANDNKTVGPGYYSVPRNDFLKRSYNIRVRSAENKVRSASNTPVTTPVTSPAGIKPATQVRQVSTPRGGYRPSSAGASPNPAGAVPMMQSPNGAQNGHATSQPTTPVARPRSASASTTPRSGGSLRAPPTAATAASPAPSSPAGAGAGVRASARVSTTASTTTPTRSTALKGRGQGLFSEQGTLEKQVQATAGAPAAPANGKQPI